MELLGRLPEEEWATARQAFSALTTSGIAIHCHRGALDEADRIAALLAEFETSADVQERASYQTGKARLLQVRGSLEAALETALQAVEVHIEMGYRTESVKEAWGIAVEAALGLDDRERAESLLAQTEALPPGFSSQFLQAQAMRFRARLADGDDADRLYRLAAGLFRELAIPFNLAVTLLERAEALVASEQGGEAMSLLTEASSIFERLRAQPWLERTAAADAAALRPSLS